MSTAPPEDRVTRRLLALFALLKDPLSRRGLAQLTECDPADVERRLTRLTEQGVIVRVDAGHWQAAEMPPTPPFAQRGDADAEDPLLSCLLNDSGLADLRRAARITDIMRRHLRDDRCAAVLLCLDVLFALALRAPWDALSGEDCRRYLHLVRQVQSVSMMFAYRMPRAMTLLPPARRAAQRIGDERSLLMLDLMEGCQQHLSHLHNLESPRALLSDVMRRIQALGDSDILTSTSTGVGLVHFMQGEYEQAIASFKQCPAGFFLDHFDYLEEVRLRYIGSAACALGRPDLGVGPMLSSLFEARERGYRQTVKWHKVHLSDQLLRVGLLEQGLALLTEVAHCCDPESETKLWFWSCRNLAYYHFQCGRIEVAHSIMTNGMTLCIQYGMPRPYYGFTWIFDMLGAFRRRGLPDIPGYGYEQEIRSGMQSPNPLYRSAALRAHVLTSLEKGPPPENPVALLRRSLALAEQAHSPLDAARCRLTLSVCLRREGRREEADALHDEARRTLYRFSQYDCPPPRPGGPSLPPPERLDLPDEDACLRELSDRLGSLAAAESREDIFQHILAALCASLQVERGAFLGMAPDTGEHTLLASCYLPAGELKEWLGDALDALKISASGQFARLRGESGSYAVLRLRRAVDDQDLVFLACCAYLRHKIDLQDEGVFLRTADVAGTELHKALLWHDKIHRREHAAIERVRLVTSQENRLEQQFYGHSLQPLLHQADMAAPSDASILILGETGVGKEVLARRIHEHSGRPGLFVPVHPAGVTESLFESEFLGHEKGAFTGAYKQKLGLFELAHQGTLFIDELGEIPLSLQVRLLRVLQEKTFLRVGGTQEIRSDFRLVAATNRDLKKMVEEGSFREDLYYRVAVIPLFLPPLRERRDDILMLANLFLRQYAARYQRPTPEISPEEREKLRRHDWPGNIRELRSTIERAVILHAQGEIRFDLPLSDARRRQDAPTPRSDAAPLAEAFARLPTLEQLEKSYMEYVLQRTRGRIDGEDGALRILGMKRSTLYARIKKYGLDAASRLYGKPQE